MQSTATQPGLRGDCTSQTERAVLALREKVLRGDFQPGERLTELSLVPLLGVSRTPVRLALERLANQGLLEPLRSGGFRLREFTIGDIWESIEVRGALEGTAARFAAERLVHADETAELRRSVLDIQNCIPTDVDKFVLYLEENRRFHRELWRLAKSSMLLRALEDVCALPFAEPGALVFCFPEEEPELPMQSAAVAIEHHRSLVEAIEHRESGRAESLAREHARMSRRNLNRALGNRDLLCRIPGVSLIPQSDWPT